jgi:DNA repair exonuclease SbcCD ATPase subunit
MTKKYKNPTIRVEWEDNPENFTQERKNRVKSYFQKKYNAKNVSVILKAKKVKKTEQDEIITDNLYDLNYQKKLIKEYVKTNAKDISAEFLDKLDNKVNEKLTAKKDITFKINECKIKSILFNNFLSYGENNTLDFTKLSGLVTINGPLNNGNMVGKTTLLNAVVFLLFGTTFSTKKNEEIFNLYTNENEVKVSGVIEIDGDDYNLERVLTRKPKKKGSAEWSYSSVFNLYKLNPDGTEMNETEEQRRETEKSLKESIGDIEDFLLTIVATSNNLEDIIDSGATDRGKIFSKFMGLDILQEKADICKTLYTEYQKGLKSNQYNIEELKTSIEENKNKLDVLKNDIDSNQKEIDVIVEVLSTLRSGKDDLLKEMVKIDPEVSKLNYSSLLSDKSSLEVSIKEKTEQYDKIKMDVDHLEHHYDEVKYNEMLSSEKELLSLLSS